LKPVVILNVNVGLHACRMEVKVIQKMETGIGAAGTKKFWTTKEETEVHLHVKVKVKEQ
jgi:hypothetical protein